MLTGNFLLVEDASRTKRQITCGTPSLVSLTLCGFHQAPARQL